MRHLSLESVFKRLATLLKKHAKGLCLKETVFKSKAKIQKPALHLYGKKSVKIFNRPEQPTYIAGIMLQKDYVGFY